MIRTGKVLNLRKIKKSNFFNENKALLIMCLIFIVGILFAVFSSKNAMDLFKSVFSFLYLKRIKWRFIKVFFLSFSVYFSVLTVVFLCGSSLMGAILIPITVFCLGFLSGGISSYLYSAYSLKGIAFNAVVVIPPVLLFLTVLFFASKCSFYFSVDIVRMTLVKGSAVNISENFKKFCSKYSVYAVLIVVASLVDTIFSSLFIKLFNF